MNNDFFKVRANGISVFCLAQFTHFSKGLTLCQQQMHQSSKSGWYIQLSAFFKDSFYSSSITSIGICGSLTEYVLNDEMYCWKFTTRFYVFMRWIPVLGKCLVKCLFRVIIAGHLWVGICGGKCPRRTWMLLKTLIRPCLGKWVHNFGGNFQGNVWGNFQVNVGGNFQGNVGGIV